MRAHRARHVLASALYCVVWLVGMVNAGPPKKTPEQTYRDAKAALEKNWEKEDQFYQKMIQNQEQNIANLNQRLRNAKPEQDKLREILQNQVRNAETRLADTRNKRTQRERQARQQIEEIARKLEDAHRNIDQGVAEFQAGVAQFQQAVEAEKQKFEKQMADFKAKIEGTIEDLQKLNKLLTGKYEVRYDLNHIETNLGGKQQTLTIEEFAELRLFGPNGPKMPPANVDKLRNMPGWAKINVEGLGFTIEVNAEGKTGRIGGLIDYKEAKFLGGGSGGILLTGPLSLAHLFAVDGAIRASGTPMWGGHVTNSVVGTAGGQGGGIYVRVPFRALKR